MCGLFDEVLRGDGLEVVYATDGVGKHFCHGDDCGFGTVFVEGDGVGENHLYESAVLYALGSGVAHDGVRGECAHRFGSFLNHEVGGFGDCSCRVDHVVNQDYVFVFDVADNCHRGHYVGFGALFVAEHQGHVEVFRVGVGSLGAAYVGSGYYEVLEVEALYVGDEYGRGVEVVNGNIEESLNLVGVEVHGDHAVYTGGLEEVADEFCRD